MEAPVGTCSICGGEVVKHVGAWHAVVPPRGRCTSCGGVEASGPVVPMRPAQPQIPQLARSCARQVTSADYREIRNTSHAIGVWCPA